MDLRLERVTDAGDMRLLNYCAEHGSEHDSSSLPGRDFNLSPDYPAYLLLEEERPVGAVVLIRTSRYRGAQKGRFSILHSVLGSPRAYSMLLGAIHPHFRDLRTVTMFIPEGLHDTGLILAQLGFHIERYSFVLRREGQTAAQASFPEGCVVQHLAPSDRHELGEFAMCLNAAFTHLEGHIDLSGSDISAWFEEEGYLEGGLCLLRRKQEPVGTVWVTKDNEDSKAGDISAFGLLSTHRGKGLGRTLSALRDRIRVGQGPPPRGALRERRQ